MSRRKKATTAVGAHKAPDADVVLEAGTAALQDLRLSNIHGHIIRLEALISVCIAALPQMRGVDEPGIRTALEIAQETSLELMNAIDELPLEPTAEEQLQFTEQAIARQGAAP